MEQFILTKDSKLLDVSWVYNEQTKTGEYETKEVQTITPYSLHEKHCILEDGITLLNIFNFLSKDKQIWDFYLGNWCSQYIEASQTYSQPNPNFKYLELFWCHTSDKYDKKYEAHISNKMGLHAIDSTNEACSLILTPLSEWVLLPIKLNTNCNVYKTNFLLNREETITLGEQIPTLFQILYGIIRELSFHGSLEDSKEVTERTNKIIEDILNDCKEA